MLIYLRVKSIMVYACPTWEHAADARLSQLQNRVLRAIGNLDRRTSVHEMHVALKIPYVYDYIKTSFRKQAEVIQNHLNPNVRAIGQGEAMDRKHKRLKLGGGQAYGRSSDWSG
jgi:hypothetical protein